MCGIAGIISKGINVDVLKLKNMTTSIKHRGPDGEGLWLSDDGKVGLGHRRLSIIDVSENASQPMHFKQYTITFNGEIYNYLELAELLKKVGYTFKTQSDTEVLLKLYDYKGIECLQDLDGMFAFFIWDSKTNQGFCARDRFGEKPFFYTFTDKQEFIFASEIKAIKACGVKLEANYKMAVNFLYNPYYLNDSEDKSGTFYNNIKKIPNSSYLIIDSNLNYTVKSYWDLDYRNQINKDSTLVAKQQVENHLINSVKNRLRSDVPVGSSLSGGLDSSGIVSLISNQKKNSTVTQKVFSAKFKNFSKDESVYIELLSKNLGLLSFDTFPTKESLDQQIEKLFYHQDEPFPSTSMFAQWEVMKLANQHNVKVLLDGQGADEVFGGYLYYYRFYLNKLKQKNLTEYSCELNFYREFHEPNYNKSKGFRYYLSDLKGKILNLIKNKNHILNPNYIPLLQKSNNANYENLNDYLYQSSKNCEFLEHLLRFSDRSSMAFGVEVRLPYLQHELVQYLFSLPDNFKINKGWTKYILRESLDKYLPKEICWRKDKIGYETPQETWLNSEKMDQLFINAIELLKNEEILSSKVSYQDKNLQIFKWNIIMLGLYFKNIYE